MAEVLRTGGSLALAASHARVDMTAVRSWRRIGRGRATVRDGNPSEHLRELCRAFVRAVDAARAEALVTAHKQVKDAGEKDWRASVALLEYERKVQLANGTREIQRLQAEKLRRELDGTLVTRSETTITGGVVILPPLDPEEPVVSTPASAGGPDGAGPVE